MSYSLNINLLVVNIPFKVNTSEGIANIIRILFLKDRSKLAEKIKTAADLANENSKWKKEYDSLSSSLKEEDKLYENFKNNSEMIIIKDSILEK